MYHRKTDICLLQRRRIVGSVSCHSDHVLILHQADNLDPTEKNLFEVVIVVGVAVVVVVGV